MIKIDCIVLFNDETAMMRMKQMYQHDGFVLSSVEFAITPRNSA
jgi:hypothetical protein